MKVVIVISVCLAAWAQTSVAKDGKQPRLSIAPNGTACVVYGNGDSIYCSVSTDGGKAFGEGTKVGEVPSLMCGMRRGPQVAATKDFIVVTGIGKEGNALAWSSKDWGKTWEGPVKINDIDRAGREGLHAICAGKENEVFAVWLDLRDDKTKLFGSLSKDGAKSWSKNVCVYQSPDGFICQCCQPQCVSDKKGTYYAMWRNQVKGDRDMWMATSKDGATFLNAQKLGTGTWKIDQCPMDGGGISVDASGRIATVWRREKKVYVCYPGQKEGLLGDGSQGSVVMLKDGAHKVWQENGNVLYSSATASKPANLGKGVCSTIASSPDGKVVVAVWESDGGIQAASLGK